MIADLFRRWKRSRRLDAAHADLKTRKAGRPHGLDAPLIVSLTSYPPRFATLPLVLQSIVTQSIRPDRVILWLDAGDDAALPAPLHALDVEIRICPNWRSYKKIIPTLVEAPGSYIVTADDDVHYGGDWLAGLVAAADAGVVCHRAHRLALDGQGRPRPYADWQRNLDAPDSGPLIFPTGVGGVLYAPGAFHDDVTRADLFQRFAPSADDVWLYWMHRMAGSRSAKIGGRFRITEWPGTQSTNLRSQNLSGDGNDRAVRAMLDRYGFPA